MLRVARESVHDEATTSDAAQPPYRSSGLPDDFLLFLSDLVADEQRPTPSDLDELWALATPTPPPPTTGADA